MIEKSDVVEDGHDIGSSISAMLVPQIELLESDVERGNRKGFLKHYETMVDRCNACHTANERVSSKFACQPQACLKIRFSPWVARISF